MGSNSWTPIDDDDDIFPTHQPLLAAQSPTPIPKHHPKIPAGQKNQKGNNKSLIKMGQSIH